MFTPYLEAYFEQNAYPSAADQESLAKKGNMDRVKITNWVCTCSLSYDLSLTSDTSFKITGIACAVPTRNPK